MVTRARGEYLFFLGALALAIDALFIGTVAYWSIAVFTKRRTASGRRLERGLPAREDHHCHDELLIIDLVGMSRSSAQHGEHASGGGRGSRTASSVRRKCGAGL